MQGGDPMRDAISDGIVFAPTGHVGGLASERGGVGGGLGPGGMDANVGMGGAAGMTSSSTTGAHRNPCEGWVSFSRDLSQSLPVQLCVPSHLAPSNQMVMLS